MFWDELSEGDREVLRSAGVRTSYPVGTCLFRDGDAPTHALVVLSGLVKLTRSAASGQGLLIDLRGEGYVLGELGAVSGEPRAATVEVVEPVEAILISAPVFRQLLKDNSSLAYTMLESVVLKLQQATDRRIEARSGDALGRLCTRLVELAEGQEPSPEGVVEITSALTQQELAEWIGVSRDSVVLALRTIRDEGWIETGRRRIRILDLESLKAAAVE